MEPITLHINGEYHHLLLEPSWPLLKVLRDVLEFKGTKCGCENASCGACMVIVDDKAVKSCIVTVEKVKNSRIETIEGMMRANNTLHPLQQAFIDCGAVQCGYCTPGMVMSAKALLNRNLNPTEEEVCKAIDKNLCRCTGYVKIVEAVLEGARRMREEAGHE